MLPRAEILAWRSVAPWDDEGDMSGSTRIATGRGHADPDGPSRRGAHAFATHNRLHNERIRSMLGRMDTARATSE